MGTDYTYYRVKPGSDADKAFDAQFASIKVMNEYAEQFGKDWLGKIEHFVISNDCTVFGFVPGNDKPWGPFDTELKAAGIDWTSDTNKTHRWIRPRAAGKKDVAGHALKAKWDARPKAKGWEWVCSELFGMSRFCQSLHMYSMYANWQDDNRIVGVPWLAANGFMQDWGSGTFKLADGLIAIPHDEAMWLVYKTEIEDIKKARLKREQDKSI
jgi:hypothetical protein